MPKQIANFRAFCIAAKIKLYDWQTDAFLPAVSRERGRFKYQVAGISVSRGNGKSYGGAAVGLWRLLFGPPVQDVLSCALDFDGAKIVLDHAKAILRECPELSRFVEVQANALHIPETGSRWTITSREHTASRGRHPTVIIYDEGGWVRDSELFASLLSGQASVDDPLFLMVSTVGRRRMGPLWHISTLAEGGDPHVYWYHSHENLSPKVSQEFLDRQRRILLPAQFAREHQNSWVDAADSFVTASDVDFAMGHGWGPQYAGDPHKHYFSFVDIGTIHDPAVVGIGHADGGLFFLDHLTTLQGSRESPVQIRDIEELLLALATRFAMTKIQIESWQGIGAVQKLERLGLPVEIFTPTMKSNSEQWPILAHCLSAKTLILFPHVRLREELLGLSYEVGPTGVKVIDRGKTHQDHAVVIRGLCAMMQTIRSYNPAHMATGFGGRAAAPFADASRAGSGVRLTYEHRVGTKAAMESMIDRPE